MYCKNCGNKLNENANFCTKCGTKVSEIREPLGNTQTKPSFENAVMVLSASKKDGLFKRTSTYVVFFKDRIVLAMLTPERQKAESKDLSDQIKAEGKGFFKGSVAMMKYWGKYGNRYYNMGPEDILREENSNLMIYNSDISKIVFRRLDSVYDAGSGAGDSLGILEIHCSLGKISATHNYTDGNKNIKRVLESLYGDRMKYKGIKLLFSSSIQKDGFI